MAIARSILLCGASSLSPCKQIGGALSGILLSSVYECKYVHADMNFARVLRAETIVFLVAERSVMRRGVLANQMAERRSLWHADGWRRIARERRGGCMHHVELNGH